MMEYKLSEEINQAVQRLGTLLRQNETVQAYLRARQMVEQDQAVRDLENQLYTMYESMLQRQQAGENLTKEEINAFNELRQQVFTNPLISEREARLTPLKALFAEVAVEISTPLGVDYTILAQ
ncbi:MAG: YlbF family regulator [Anaerolineales bacterium]